MLGRQIESSVTLSSNGDDAKEVVLGTAKVALAEVTKILKGVEGAEVSVNIGVIIRRPYENVV